MSDPYSFLPSFFTTDPSPKGGTPTYAQLEARRKIAMALATRNRPYPKTIGEGLTALGEGLGEGYNLATLQRAEAGQAATDAEGAARLRGDAPATAAPGQTSSVDDPAMNALALASPEDVAAANAVAAPQTKSMTPEEFLVRTARNETGAETNPYRAIGQRNRRNDYPLGKYQIMGENVPEWSEKYLGKKITPQEFLLDDKAQDAIALGRGSEYLAKYGPEGAAEAWFAGEEGRIQGRNGTRPNLGRHLDTYVEKFNRPLINRNQVTASAVNAPAVAPVPDLVSDPAMQEPPPVQLPGQVAALDTGTVSDAAPITADPRVGVVNSLVAQQQPAPPPPQQVAQAGGALPAVPPTMPVVPPQNIPKAPTPAAQPVEPGPEPKLKDFTEGNPALREQMKEAEKVRDNPSYSDALRLRAREKYQELEKRANDAYGKQWTVWHERQKVKEKFKLEEDEKNITLETARGKAYDEAETRRLKHRFGGEEPPKFFEKMDKEKGVAEIASKVRDDNRLILRAVSDGVIMGWGANFRLNTAKLAAWALQNGYSSEEAANTEILRALGGSRIREALAQVNPSGPSSTTDTMLARQLSGADPAMEPKSFLRLLHKSSEYNAKLLNDFEDKRDYYLAGERSHRNYQITAGASSPKEYLDTLLQNRDNKAARAAYDDRFGDGSAALEIERFKRRTRRGE